MKKGCFLLLILITLTYAYQGYKVTEAYIHDKIKIKTSGKLSDIAGNVLPVPLETPGSGEIQHVRHVRRDGNHLFLLSDNRLLHFNIHGKFIRQIAHEINDENDARITQYALNTEIRQIIVIDSLRNVSKYDYNGNRISKERIKHPWQNLTAFAFHDGYLWISAETLVTSHDRPDACQIKHDLYQLDTDMNEISRQPLRIADTGRERIFTGTCVSELLADEEGVYAYSPPFGTEHLLKDTLYITEQKKIPLLYPEKDTGTACIYPVRKGMRYMISTCNNHAGHPFTFCYDQLNFTAYLLPGGFRDDFFGTGYISDLQPVDMYNKSYCFIKSGRDIAKKYPAKAISEDQPVLFLVNLNA
ncbi:MAG: 6-bladed beta-propeller [Tannerella sp.]|jgi:hypothetical protein|nr:6-bladed beta-propeller [Tannerella sp.]